MKTILVVVLLLISGTSVIAQEKTFSKDYLKAALAADTSIENLFQSLIGSGSSRDGDPETIAARDVRLAKISISTDADAVMQKHLEVYLRTTKEIQRHMLQPASDGNFNAIAQTQHMCKILLSDAFDSGSVEVFKSNQCE